jgi:hypothetical protein
MDHSSNYSQQVKYASFVKVPKFTSATFLPWFLGSTLSFVVISKFIKQRHAKGLASHSSIMENDGANKCFPLPVSCREHFASSPLVED